MLRPVGEAEALEVIHRQLVALGTGHALIEERQLDVLDRGLEADEVEGLENEADHPVAVVGGLALGQVLDQAAVDVVFARVVVVQNAQDIEQRGLAGAGGSHDRDEFPLVDAKVDSFQDVQRLTVVVCLIDVFEFDEHIVSY